MPKSFKVLSWNIDTNLGKLEDGIASIAYPEWKVKNRMPSVVKTISSFNPDILLLQELRNCTNNQDEVVDSSTPIEEFLSNNYYEYKITYYNAEGGKSFKYATAFKANKFSLKDNKIKYFTKTENPATEIRENNNSSDEAIKEHNFGEFWERGASITNIINLETNKELSLCNIHMGISLKARTGSTKLIAKFLQDEININPEIQIIAAGDFNSFPNWGGAEQMAIIEDAGFADAAKNMKLPNGELAKFSFISFPYDFAKNDMRLQKEGIYEKLEKIGDSAERKHEIGSIFKEECEATSGVLDHFITHNLNVQSLTLELSSQFDPAPESYDEESIMEYIMSHHDEGPAFASDHQPLLAVVEDNSDF